MCVSINYKRGSAISSLFMSGTGGPPNKNKRFVCPANYFQHEVLLRLPLVFQQ